MSTIIGVCNDKIFLYLNLSICITSFILGLIVISHGIYNLRSDTSILSQFKILFIFCSITFLFQIICHILLFISCLISLYSYPTYFYLIELFIYNLELVILLLLLLMRLYYTFRDTMYQMNNKILFIIKISFIIIVLIQLGSSIFSMIYKFKYITNAFIMGLFGILLYFTLSVILVFMFVKRLQ